MSSNPYASAKAKLARGYRFITELDDFLVGYKDARLIPRQVPPSGMGWFVRVPDPHPSTEIQSALGDAVHNLRSALDHSAVATVVQNGGNPKKVYFPFADNASELEVMIKRKNFNRASAEAQDLLRSLRPYKGGHEGLRALHDLDVMDKHHTLIPTLSGAGITGTMKFGGMSITDVAFGLKDGEHAIHIEQVAPALYAALKPRPPLNSTIPAVHVKINAMFGPDQPFAFKEVTPTLRSLAELVASIIESFEALSFRQSP